MKTVSELDANANLASAATIADGAPLCAKHTLSVCLKKCCESLPWAKGIPANCGEQLRRKELRWERESGEASSISLERKSRIPRTYVSFSSCWGTSSQLHRPSPAFGLRGVWSIGTAEAGSRERPL